jgi:hypothetical protein
MSNGQRIHQAMLCAGKHLPAQILVPSDSEPPDGLCLGLQAIRILTDAIVLKERSHSSYLMKLKEKPLCPVCISAMAVMVAGATSPSGLTALFIRQSHLKNGAKKIAPQPNSKKDSL